MRPFYLLIFIALLSCSTPPERVAQGLGHATQKRPTLSPEAAAVVERWRSEVFSDSGRAKANRGETVLEDLRERVRIDQASRTLMPSKSVSGLSDADWFPAYDAMWSEINKIDAENTDHLKRILPVDGWFRVKRDGVEVARDAWLLVQHSPDPQFQRRVLEMMAPLVSQADADGGQYALLYDRVAISEGRRQRYGSQMTCVAGHYEPSPVEDRASLDGLRASLGMPPLAEYVKNWAGQTC